jgi:hypothetical protein
LPPPILILEGVTGAGKSSLLAELRPLLDARISPNVEFIPEDDTLGNLMTQIRDPDWCAHPTFAALCSVLTRLEEVASETGKRFLVERFHLTAFALFPHWDCYQRYEERLAKLGTAMVLLTFPTDLAELRSIQRDDRKDWAQGLDNWYGSRAQAVDAVVESQRRRVKSLERTKLPFLHIDTREQDWRRYAETVTAYWA